MAMCFAYGATKWVEKNDSTDLWTKRKLSQEGELLRKGPHCWRCDFQVSQMEQTLEAKSCQGTRIWSNGYVGL